MTFDGIGDTVLESSTNAYATISGLTTYTYEPSVLGTTSTNHYARFNTGSGAALDSTMNKTILNYDFTISRPLSTRSGLRGASSAFTLEPLQLGRIDSKVTVKMSELDNATFDLWGIWQAKAQLKGEVFLDGSRSALE